MRADSARRLTDSAETAASLSGGLVLVNDVSTGEEQLFSQNYACEDCGISIEELAPRMFSFNSPYGACPTCSGLGTQVRVDPELIIRNKNLSIMEGGIQAPGWGSVKGDTIAKMYYDALAKKYHFKLTTPIKDLPKDVLDVIMYGTGGESLELQYDTARGKGVLKQPFEGLVNNIERRYRDTQSQSMREEYEEYMGQYPCPDCGGKRLKKGGPGRHRRRTLHHGLLRHAHHTLAGVHRGPAGQAQRPRAHDSRHDNQGDTLEGCTSSPAWACNT